MKRLPKNETVWLWLTAPVTALAAYATIAELGFGVFRGDEPYFVAQAVGQDLVTLAVAVPALVAAAALAGRGSRRARLVWLGVLAYFVYTYAIYAFHVRFNALFLVYVGLLGCSLYALIGGLATTRSEEIRGRLAGKRHVRQTSIFLAVVATLFYLMWLSEVVPAVISGGVPQSVLDNGTPTSGVHVLDMAWILPALLLTSFWLRRGRAIGYALAGALLTFMALLAFAILAMVVAMALAGQAVSVVPAAIFGILGAVSLWMLVRYLKGLGEK